MEIKDWIILFVPILCNGLILTLLGKYVDYKIKKHENRNQIENSIKEEFRRLLIQAKVNYTKVILTFVGNETYDYMEKITAFNSTLMDMMIFCRSIQPLLEEQEKMVYEIISLYNEFVRLSPAKGNNERAGEIWNNIGTIMDKLTKLCI